MSHSPAETGKQRFPDLSPRILLFLLLVVVAAAYSNSIYSPFVLDDDHSFAQNPLLGTADHALPPLEQIGQSQFGVGRFMPMLTFAIDRALSQPDGSVSQYHYTNIAIHLAATLALFFFLRGILRTPKGTTALGSLAPDHFCLLVTGLWALSPLQTNAVTYIVQRMASLTAFFYLASLACYLFARTTAIRPRRYLLYAASLGLAVSAFFSKENSATLPLALLLLEATFISPDLPRRIGRRLTPRTIGILLATAFLLSPVMAKVWYTIVTSGYAIRSFTLGERLLTEARVVVYYLSLLALPLPARMTLDYDFPLSTSLLTPPTTLAAILFLTLLFYLACKTLRRLPLFGFGVLWFFLTLVIESSVIPLELVFEHRLYLPSVGFFIAVLALVDLATTRWLTAPQRRQAMPWLLFSFTLLLVASSLLTTMRNYDWRDQLSIYADCVRKAPHKIRPHVNYGRALALTGRPDEALREFNKALQLAPHDHDAYLDAANNIVATLWLQKRRDEAIARGKAFLKEMPVNCNFRSFPRFLSNLGFAYQTKGELKIAFDLYQEALLTERDYLAQYLEQYVLDVLYLAYDTPKARPDFGFISGIDRDAAVWARMARVYFDIREFDASGAFLAKALAKAPDNPELLARQQRLHELDDRIKAISNQIDITNHLRYKQNFSYRFLIKTVDFINAYYTPLRGLADIMLQKAMATYPDDLFIRTRLATRLIVKGQLDAAMALVRTGLDGHPDSPPLLDLEAVVYQRQHHPREELRTLQKILQIYPGHPQALLYTVRIRQLENHRSD